MTLNQPRIYADFQNLDNSNRLRLTCAGTVEDLKRQKVQLKEGLVVTVYMDDADEFGRPDDLLAEGTVQFNQDECCWVVSVDWNGLRHASSDAASQGSSELEESIPAKGDQ